MIFFSLNLVYILYNNFFKISNEFLNWVEGRGTIPQPLGPQPSALPIELPPTYQMVGYLGFEPRLDRV